MEKNKKILFSIIMTIILSLFVILPCFAVPSIPPSKPSNYSISLLYEGDSDYQGASYSNQSLIYGVSDEYTSIDDYVMILSGVFDVNEDDIFTVHGNIGGAFSYTIEGEIYAYDPYTYTRAVVGTPIAYQYTGSRSETFDINIKDLTIDGLDWYSWVRDYAGGELIFIGDISFGWESYDVDTIDHTPTRDVEYIDGFPYYYSYFDTQQNDVYSKGNLRITENGTNRLAELVDGTLYYYSSVTVDIPQQESPMNINWLLNSLSVLLNTPIFGEHFTLGSVIILYIVISVGLIVLKVAWGG